MKKKITPFVENIGEATVACLLTMVQGNILALGLSHWIIASQTGLIAGVLASVALLASSTSNRWLVAVTLGVITAIVDYFMHPGMFGPVFVEAIITGIGAAVLSFIVGAILRRRRAKRDTAVL
ncbi:MAG: hypothetical protein KJP04_08125 [Arenicella sp.]|nr:hypothetical protein [Arenicella sp.]